MKRKKKKIRKRKNLVFTKDRCERGHFFNEEFA